MTVRDISKGERTMRERIRYMVWSGIGSRRKRQEQEIVGEVILESNLQIVVEEDGGGMTATIRKVNVTGRERLG